MIRRAALDSRFGRLVIEEAEGAIVRLRWSGMAAEDDTPLLAEARRQLQDYCGGARRSFDLPLALGEGFQARFLTALTEIPFGETRRYGELAQELDVSAQTIGQACGANPIPVIVPCHRVLGATGLGGFSAPGGIETKVALLRHEGAAGLLI